MTRTCYKTSELKVGAGVTSTTITLDLKTSFFQHAILLVHEIE